MIGSDDGLITDDDLIIWGSQRSNQNRPAVGDVRARSRGDDGRSGSAKPWNGAWSG